MAKFTILDPSLDSVGGHHFDYDYHTVCAAQQLGYEVVLATNHHFDRRDALPDACRVLRTFRYHTYNRYTELAGIRDLQTDEIKAKVELRGDLCWLDKLKLFFSQWIDGRKRANPEKGRRRRIQRFAKDVERLFESIGLNSGDHVFVPTLSEIELLGLARFLNSEPSTRQVHWHVQFHFSLYHGFEFADAQRQQLDRMRRFFTTAVSQTSDHHLHFYTSSAPLARQYNRLGVALFEPLAYPVNPRFKSSEQGRRAEGPLRITLAGVPREEKGSRIVNDLADRISADLFDQQRAMLVVQARDCESGHPGVVQVQHPLELDDYVELIRTADVGVLMYDRQRYYFRRAGVLGEMLTAGVPVVVPAGCWLAEQISEPIYQHLEVLIDGQTSADIAPCNNVPPSTTDCIISLETDNRRHIELTVDQFGDTGKQLQSDTTICGPRCNNDRMHSLIHLHHACHSLKIRWQNPYGTDAIQVAKATLNFIDASDQPTGHLPLGKVGLIAANPGQVPELLREIVDHFEHYHRSADEFSNEWFARHDPQCTVGQLLEKATDAIRTHAA